MPTMPSGHHAGQAGRAGVPLGELAASLPGSRLITGPDVMDGYRRDQADAVPAGQPAGVLLAQATTDVAAALRWADRNEVPAVPRGAGTGLSGGAAAIDGCLVVCAAAAEVIDRLAGLGIDLATVGRILEGQGLATFRNSFTRTLLARQAKTGHPSNRASAGTRAGHGQKLITHHHHAQRTPVMVTEPTSRGATPAPVADALSPAPAGGLHRVLGGMMPPPRKPAPGQPERFRPSGNADPGEPRRTRATGSVHLDR
jgi:hypothetical protein